MKIKTLPRCLRVGTLLLAALLCGMPLMTLPTAAAEGTVYLGDRSDLFLGRDSLDGLGMNTAHSGEPLKIGKSKTTFDKGVGFHCQPDRDAYVEFDISSLGATWFSASVGVLAEASYFLEWGSISFHVYGDGELLASSNLRNWGDEPYFLSCRIEGVKTLRLVQKNEGNHSCDAGVWGNAAVSTTEPTPPAGGGTDSDDFDPDKTDRPQPAELTREDTAYMSDLYWLESHTYSGNHVGRDCNTVNEIIFSSDGTFFPKGVGFHAVSGAYDAYVDINIDGLGYKTFATYFGVSETLSAHDISMASVKCAIFGDGKLLAESEVMTFGKPMVRLDCSIEGVQTLRIAVAGAPGIAGGWGTFGGAAVSRLDTIPDDLLMDELVFEPESESDPTPIPDPGTTTEPESAPDTTAESSAATVQEPSSENADPTDTEPPLDGCASTMTSTGALLLTGAAVALCKRKED